MLRNIQFAWRSASFVIFFITIFSVDGLDYFYKIFKHKLFPTLILLIILLINLFISTNKVALQKSVGLYPPIHGMGWQSEYLPTETLYNNYINTRENGIIILSGSGKTKINKNSIPNMEFTVTKINNYVDLELPRIYYLGYKIVDNKGNKINYKKDKNGFIKIRVKKSGKYTVKYTGTTLYIIFKYITIITFILHLYIIKLSKKKDKKS